MSIKQIIHQSTGTAFPAGQSPGLVIREAGLVAHIYRDLRTHYQSTPTVKADLRGYPPADSSYTWPNCPVPNVGTIDVFRVQLELKISAVDGLPDSASQKGDRDRTDIVVFRDTLNPVLDCQSGGPGDIVAAVRNPSSVLAAVEVKACPSADGSQLLLILEDIARLMRLAGSGIEAHMVIADKSQGYFGKWNQAGRRNVVAIGRTATWKPGPLNKLLQLHTNSVQQAGGPICGGWALHATPPVRSNAFVTVHVVGLTAPMYVY